MSHGAEAKLRELRQRYQAAYTAYQSCVDALTALGRRREQRPDDLWEREAKALRELNDARGAYRDMLLEMAFEEPSAQPPEK